MKKDPLALVAPEVLGYLQELLPPESPLLSEIRQRAEKNRVPLVEPEVASLLRFLFLMKKPRRVLEIGTAVGYSALLMAAHMEGGEIVTIDRYAPYLQQAKENTARYTGPVTITQLEGEATDLLATLEGTFDVLFIDAAKGHYQRFLDGCYHRLNPGGLIISDNVLYRGMIASDAHVIRRKRTIVKRMRGYLKALYAHPELTTTVLPLGDGVALSVKEEKEEVQL